MPLAFIVLKISRVENINRVFKLKVSIAAKENEFRYEDASC